MLALTTRPFARRSLLASAAAALCAPALGRPARAAAAEFTYKYATGQDPTHPVNIHLHDAFGRIRERTGGSLDLQLFPANQLGTDTDLLSQVRNGAIEFLNISSSILATLVPVAGIVNTAYAFADYDAVWKAMDGKLGAFIQAQIDKAGLVSPVRVWDNGFRQVTSSTHQIRTPDDLKGFKIRVPPAPMLTSFFAAIGASPTPMNFAEVYTALQTGVIDGQENALSLITTTRLYEVQKFVAMTGHSWDGYWPLANRRAWERLPDATRAIVVEELDRAGTGERADVAERDRTLRGFLTGKGMSFADVDKAKFRDAVAATSYYKDWKAKYGPQAWGELEAAAGRLA